MTQYLLGALSGSLPVLLVLILVRSNRRRLFWLLAMAAVCIFMIYATSSGLIGGG